jgi:hypothetical protein
MTVHRDDSLEAKCNGRDGKQEFESPSQCKQQQPYARQSDGRQDRRPGTLRIRAGALVLRSIPNSMNARATVTPHNMEHSALCVRAATLDFGQLQIASTTHRCPVPIGEKTGSGSAAKDRRLPLRQMDNHFFTSTPKDPDEDLVWLGSYVKHVRLARA